MKNIEQKNAWLRIVKKNRHRPPLPPPPLFWQCQYLHNVNYSNASLTIWLWNVKMYWTYEWLSVRTNVDWSKLIMVGQWRDWQDWVRLDCWSKYVPASWTLTAFLSFLWQTTRGGTPCGLGLNHPGALSRTVRLLIRRISTITQTPFPHLLPLCLPSDIGMVGKKWQPRNPVSTFFWGQI